MAKILLFGDIMGRPGREAISAVLPLWQSEHKPDVIVGNVENLTHGKGIILRHIEELTALGFDAFTSGNHVFDSGPRAEECFDKFDSITRPANYTSLGQDGRAGEIGMSSDSVPGHGFYRFAKNGQQYLVINLGGRLFFDKQFRGDIANPFFAFDAIYSKEAQKDDIIIVDLHAEATSEKNAFAWHVDGRATIVYGTHTHIPTADTKILPKGTIFQTDLGMSGALNSVLGVIVENSLNVFLEKARFKLETPEEGAGIVNALLIEVGEENGVNKIINFQRLQTETK